jgi:hypothetical protein
VKIILRNPKRAVELSGKRRVKELLVDDELLTSDAVVGGDDVVEVRPVMSGGRDGGRP